MLRWLRGRKLRRNIGSFETWAQLDKWITDYYGGRPKMWRYEFKR